MEQEQQSLNSTVKTLYTSQCKIFTRKLKMTNCRTNRYFRGKDKNSVKIKKLWYFILEHGNISTTETGSKNTSYKHGTAKCQDKTPKYHVERTHDIIIGWKGMLSIISLFDMASTLILKSPNEQLSFLSFDNIQVSDNPVNLRIFLRNFL